LKKCPLAAYTTRGVSISQPFLDKRQLRAGHIGTTGTSTAEPCAMTICSGCERPFADIRYYLNENGVKTSKGNFYNNDSIRRILTNRKYLGIYIYGDIEVPGGIPRIIGDQEFNDTQALLEKNKKAPARAKAVEENYLLTTRLFCGHCQAAMTGLSGTS